MLNGQVKRCFILGSPFYRINIFALNIANFAISNVFYSFTFLFDVKFVDLLAPRPIFVMLFTICKTHRNLHFSWINAFKNNLFGVSRFLQFARIDTFKNNMKWWRYEGVANYKPHILKIYALKSWRKLTLRVLRKGCTVISTTIWLSLLLNRKKTNNIVAVFYTEVKQWEGRKRKSLFDKANEWKEGKKISAG